MISLVTDRIFYFVFWTPICIALLVFLGSMLLEHRNDKKDDDASR